MASKQKQQKNKAKKQKQRQLKIKKETMAKKAATAEPIDVQVDQALALLGEGHINEGKRLIEKLRRKHGGNPLVQYSLGVLAVKKERYADAAMWFEKTVNTSPDNIEAHYNLAVAYQKLKDYTHMALAFQYVIDHGEPGSLSVKHAVKTLSELEDKLRGTTGIGLQEFLEGHMYFQKGLEHMADKEWIEAVSSFASAVKAHPGNAQSFGNMGICYAIMGKKQEALDALDKALELDPEYKPARINLALVDSFEEGDTLGENITGMDDNKGRLQDGEND